MSVTNNTSSSEDDDGVNQRSSLAYTLTLNLVIFSVLVLFFEMNRNLPRLFLKRLRKSFEEEDRVAGKPPPHLFGWIRHIMALRNSDYLQMIGLDGYMLLRFITICFKFCVFGALLGSAILAPLYAKGDQGYGGWQQYTLANVVSSGEITTDALWLPAVFSYIYLAYAMYLFHDEFEHFVLKRLEFLVQGDPDTFQQTHYTIMIENVPPALRSVTALSAFFDKLFPGEVYSAEIMLQLNDLEDLREERSQTRNKLEKAIALRKANGQRPRLTISSQTYDTLLAAISAANEHYEKADRSSDSTQVYGMNMPVPSCSLDAQPHFCSGYVTVDSISYYTHLLFQQNHTVSAAQLEYLLKMENTEEEERGGDTRAELILGYTTENMHRARSELAEKVTSPFLKSSKGIWDKITSRKKNQGGDEEHIKEFADVEGGGDDLSGDDRGNEQELTTSFSTPPTRPHVDAGASSNRTSTCTSYEEGERSGNGSFTDSNFKVDAYVENHFADNWKGKKSANIAHEENDISPQNSPHPSKNMSMKQRNARESEDDCQEVGVGGNIKNVVGDVATGLGATFTVLTKQGIKTVRIAGKGAIKSVLEATRTIELLTLGAYYTTSSTAFVTFKSRSARSISCQMLLSHEHYNMRVARAPNTDDIIWDNVSIPSAQITARENISGYTFMILAIFWSGVVTFVVNFTDLDKLSDKYDWVASLNLRDFTFYDLLNQYLSVIVLLLIILLLPFLFDFVSRYYEGLKRESDIQRSIMTRFFYYQLVNVYVTVASGTIVNSIQEIIDHPRSLLSILGEQLPQVSLFFANLLLVKTLVSVPIEMLRVWPLLQVYAVKYFRSKEKMTRRELREGAFADLPLDYGWIYPNLLFVMMITTTYSCIAPFIMPISAVYFGFVYLMYRYQLMYVYVNKYQSGGDMWYAVFDRSMIILVCGSVVLLSYLGISKTFQTGPFYLLFPQPFFIVYFWNHCNAKFIRPSAALSLECTKAIDTINAKLEKMNHETPVSSFDSDVYRQPALVEPFLRPESYRKKSQGVKYARESSFDDSTLRGTIKKDENSGEGIFDDKQNIEATIGRALDLEDLEEGIQRDEVEEHDESRKWQNRSLSRRLQRLQEVDESMLEDDIDLLLGMTEERDSDDKDDLVHNFEKIKERRSTYHSYGTTTSTYVNPRRNKTNDLNEVLLDKDKRRESK